MTTLTSVLRADGRLLAPAAATRAISIRKSVYDLTDAEVASLRAAYAAIQGIADNRGYQYLAGIHGLPQYFCHHGDIEFVIWHRPYLLFFEQALQAQVASVTLPYWDWTTERARAEGIPAIFATPTYKDASGADVANPLYSAAITFANNDGLTATNRDPGPPDALGRLARDVDQALRNTDYDRFCSAIEQPHNFIHGWAGGTMGVVPYSAFDPVFWVHHCFIEKLFCEWQDTFPSTALPPSIDGQALAPFNTTTNDVWAYSALGYQYAPDAASSSPPLAALTAAAGPPSPTHVTTIDLKRIPPDFARARLVLQEVSHPLTSFEARIFFTDGKPDASTPTAGNAEYAGSFFTFGHGGCTGGPGHCDVPPVPEDRALHLALRPRHHLTPARMSIDVTDALRAAKKSTGYAAIHMVAVDHRGVGMGPRGLDFEAVSIETT